MPSLEKVLGEQVMKNRGGELVPTKSLLGAGKVIALYFSAHWCGPCRAFTPALVDFYRKWKAGDRADKFEVVFVSSDRDSSAFAEYYSDMPWLALPYAERTKKGDLSRMYKVTGIPSLVLLDGLTGKLITSEGRKIINGDPDGRDFPWKPLPLPDILGDTFIKNTGEQVSIDSLKGKVIGFYFSAHWCPPCRTFTPTLVRVYEKIRERTDDFEIIYISSDHDEKEFQECFQEMPWLAIPLADSRKPLLASYFGVSGIPKFALVDENLKLITGDGRMAVASDLSGMDFPWKYKPLNVLKEQFGRYLNEAVCLVYFTDGEDAQMDRAKEALVEIAERERTQAEAEDEEQAMHFFVATPDEDISETVVHFLNLPRQRPLVVILDCSNAIWCSHQGYLDSSGIEKFVADYRGGELPKKAIPPRLPK